MAEAQTGETKSIINAKYKDKYKTPDWLGVQINKHCTATHEVEVPEKKDDKGKVISKATTKTVADGIDVEALSALASENGIDPAPYASMNVGQQRMNIGNRLRSLTLKRHGLTINGKWVKADAEWLKANNAPEAPTHQRDGSAIAKAVKGTEPSDKKAAAAEKAEAKQNGKVARK